MVQSKKNPIIFCKVILHISWKIVYLLIFNLPNLIKNISRDLFGTVTRQQRWRSTTDDEACDDVTIRNSDVTSSEDPLWVQRLKDDGLLSDTDTVTSLGFIYFILFVKFYFWILVHLKKYFCNAFLWRLYMLLLLLVLTFSTVVQIYKILLHFETKCWIL